MTLVISSIISIVIILIGIILSYCNYETGTNIENFSQKDIIQPTNNKTTIFKAIHRIQEDIDEVNFLLEQKKKNNKKYDEMYSWYEKQREGELSSQKENSKDAIKLDKQLKIDANKEIEKNKDQLKDMAKMEAKNELKKSKARLDRNNEKMRKLGVIN